MDLEARLDLLGWDFASIQIQNAGSVRQLTKVQTPGMSQRPNFLPLLDQSHRCDQVSDCQRLEFPNLCRARLLACRGIASCRARSRDYATSNKPNVGQHGSFRVLGTSPDFQKEVLSTQCNPRWYLSRVSMRSTVTCLKADADRLPDKLELVFIPASKVSAGNAWHQMLGTRELVRGIRLRAVANREWSTSVESVGSCQISEPFKWPILGVLAETRLSTRDTRYHRLWTGPYAICSCMTIEQRRGSIRRCGILKSIRHGSKKRTYSCAIL